MVGTSKFWPICESLVYKWFMWLIQRCQELICYNIGSSKDTHLLIHDLQQNGKTSGMIGVTWHVAIPLLDLCYT